MHSILNKKSTSQSLSWRLMGWILLFMVMTACGKISSVVYSEFADIEGDGIPQNWEYTFSPVPFDSAEIATGRFDLIAVVRYSNTCASKSVILDVESLSLEHSQPDSARVTIPLFTPDGTPTGKGNWGILEITDTLSRGISIPEGFVVSLSSPLDADATKGILDIGLKLSRSGQKELSLYNLLPISSKRGD